MSYIKINFVTETPEAVLDLTGVFEVLASYAFDNVHVEFSIE